MSDSPATPNKKSLKRNHLAQRTIDSDDEEFDEGIIEVLSDKVKETNKGFVHSDCFNAGSQSSHKREVISLLPSPTSVSSENRKIPSTNLADDVISLITDHQIVHTTPSTVSTVTGVSSQVSVYDLSQTMDVYSAFTAEIDDTAVVRESFADCMMPIARWLGNLGINGVSFANDFLNVGDGYPMGLSTGKCSMICAQVLYNMLIIVFTTICHSVNNYM